MRFREDKLSKCTASFLEDVKGRFLSQLVSRAEVFSLSHIISIWTLFYHLSLFSQENLMWACERSHPLKNLISHPQVDVVCLDTSTVVQYMSSS